LFDWDGTAILLSTPRDSAERELMRDGRWTIA
jgi:hypothetical protein